MKLTRRSFLTRAGLCAAATIFDVATSKHKSALCIAQTPGSDPSSVKHESSNVSLCTGVHTGFAQLDEILGKMAGDSLIFIGGGHAKGKTTFALNIANRAAQQGTSVIFFSLEQSASQLANRIIEMEALDSQKLLSGKLDPREWEQITERTKALSGLPLWVDDTPALTMRDIRAKALEQLSDTESGKGLIIIDYLQLIQPANAAEHYLARLAEVSRGLKLLARELNTPVIVTLKLPRSIERRADKRPQLSDLRELGALEQDPDVVLYIFEDDQPNWGSNAKVEIELIVTKNRYGQAKCSVPLVFQRTNGRFEELET